VKKMLWSLFKYNAGVEITEADTEISEFAKQVVCISYSFSHTF
jgi:hypothetical protein